MHKTYGSFLRSDDGVDKAKPKPGSDKQLPEPTDFTCLMRAKVKNKKLSTIVSMPK